MKLFPITLAIILGVASVAHADEAQREACRVELERMSKEARQQPAAEGEARAQLGPVTRIARLAKNMPACLEELQDAGFSSELDKILVRRVHEEEAARFTQDQRHVILAYIAIWVLTAGFVGFLFLRQGKLRAEIERLSAEVERAAKDAEK
jgi:CcmD family protein